MTTQKRFSFLIVIIIFLSFSVYCTESLESTNVDEITSENSSLSFESLIKKSTLLIAFFHNSKTSNAFLQKGLYDVAPSYIETELNFAIVDISNQYFSDKQTSICFYLNNCKFEEGEFGYIVFYNSAIIFKEVNNSITDFESNFQFRENVNYIAKNICGDLLLIEEVENNELETNSIEEVDSFFKLKRLIKKSKKPVLAIFYDEEKPYIKTSKHLMQLISYLSPKTQETFKIVKFDLTPIKKRIKLVSIVSTVPSIYVFHKSTLISEVSTDYYNFDFLTYKDLEQILTEDYEFYLALTKLQEHKNGVIDVEFPLEIEILKESSGSFPILIAFYNSENTKSTQLENILDKLSKTYAKKMLITKVDVAKIQFSEILSKETYRDNKYYLELYYSLQLLDSHHALINEDLELVTNEIKSLVEKNLQEVATTKEKILNSDSILQLSETEDFFVFADNPASQNENIKNKDVSLLEIFKDIIENSTKPSIVNFKAEWCSFCKTFSFIFSQVSLIEEFNEKVNFIQVDLSNENIASEFSSIIESYGGGIPLTVFYSNDGKAITHQNGLSSKETFIEFIYNALAKI
ncbi:MAG: thioredoxin family protein [Pseudomonadota bacterium]